LFLAFDEPVYRDGVRDGVLFEEALEVRLLVERDADDHQARVPVSLIDFDQVRNQLAARPASSPSHRRPTRSSGGRGRLA